MRRLLPSLMVLLAVTRIQAADPDREGFEFFEAKIRPVLVAQCYECHSAEAIVKDNLKGGLLLDSRDGSRKGGESGPAVVPGEIEESLLIGALRHESFEMPPKGKLSDEVIADFVAWIERGAPDPREGDAPVTASDIDLEAGRQHWAFQPLTPSAPPQIQDAGWVRNPVDRFVRAKQEAVGITPNTVASPRKLIRRACFDLIGLPPSPAEVEQFVSETETDPHGAWERLIDRLLQSDHYRVAVSETAG